MLSSSAIILSRRPLPPLPMAVPPARPAPDLNKSLFRRCFRVAARLAAGALFALAVVSSAADDTVTLNFVNADIDAVVKAAAEITGRNFVIDPKIKGTINIVSARPVPRELVYPTLLSALRLQGIIAVEGNGVTKLVLEADAKQQGSEVLRGPVGGSGDRLVTQVITLRYESALQLVNVLRPLITPNNTIAAYPGTNALIITDYADNLRRIDKIIASLDVPPSGEPVIVTLKNASAIDLVPLLNKLVGADTATQGGTPGDVQQRIMIVADPRSNSVLLRSENPGRAARIKAMIEQLDTPQRAGGNMFVVYLRNADAGRVAQTLRALLSGGGDVTQSAPTATASMFGNQIGGSNAAPGAQQGAQGAQGAPASAANPFTNGAGAGGGNTGNVTIQADIANNALIIMGPEPVYNNIRTIIERLDVRRAQVFVEALIVEVTSDKAAQFGIQWQVLQGLNKQNVQGFGGTNFGAPDSGNNIISGAVNLSNLGQGLNLGILNGTIAIPGLGVITNLALLIRSLEQDANANILSTPTLLTLDNEEARIIVGQNIPFVTGQYATTGNSSTVTPFQTFERHDVGVMLRVKPQITEGGTIRLNLYQEVSRVESITTTTGIVLSKRALESTVIVDDKSIVVLGGLIQDSQTNGTDKLPVAGDIPFFGQLFRYDQRQRTKTNLLVFIKPTVVRSDAQGRELTSERYDYIMNQQENNLGKPLWFWNDPGPPVVVPPQGVMPGTPQSVPGGAVPPPDPPIPRL
jgi:general secretion pathway protein D